MARTILAAFLIAGVFAVTITTTAFAQNPPPADAGITILSDTHGYDFGPYLNQVVTRVRASWYTLIPEAARLGAKGRVVVVFDIDRDGKVSDLRVVTGSGFEPLDQASRGAVATSNPFAKLPTDFSGDLLTLQFSFSYNVKP